MTRAAGALLISYGLIGFIAGLHDFDSMFLMIGNGFGYIGLRRAQDKAVDVIVASHVETRSIKEHVRKDQK